MLIGGNVIFDTHHFLGKHYVKKTLLNTILVATMISSPVLANDTATEKTSNPLVTLSSKYDYNTTAEKLKTAFASKGLTVFAIIDHSGAAKEAGLDMPPTQVLIFGNPKGGTPLMQKAPALALQLPLKVLIAENAMGKVNVRFFKAGFLATSVGEDAELTAPLSKVEKLITKVVTE